MSSSGSTSVSDVLRHSGNGTEAEAVYRRALAANSGDGAALYGLGLVFKETGRLDQALEAMTRAALVPPRLMEAFIEAGVVSAMLGRPAAASQWIRRAIETHPERPEPYFFLGSKLASENRHGDAVTLLRQAMIRQPGNIETIKALVFSLRRSGRAEEAEVEARSWSAAFPADAEAPASLAHILVERDRLQEALEEARRAVLLAPTVADWRILVARILILLGDGAGAVAELMAARAAAPDNAVLLTHLGNALKVTGEFDQARAALRRASQLAPGDATIFFELAEITRFAPGDPSIAAMENLARTPPVPARLHFALGKAYDDIGLAAQAFPHFAAGKKLHAARARYDEAGTLGAFTRMQTLFPREVFEKSRGAGSASIMPIFIVGMPRSGSTLIEQVLASHPEVAAAGEVTWLPQSAEAALALFGGGEPRLDETAFRQMARDYLARLSLLAGGRARVTDKLLANALLVGVIHLAFPKARILHSLRDIMDTCFSCFTRSFGERLAFSNDLGTLGRYARAHAGLMAHWHRVLPEGAITDVRYEDMVADLEGQARRIVAACGLAWDARCIAFHQTVRPVNTASVAQVRRPLYASAVGRWKPYEAWLKPLKAALGDLAAEEGAEGTA